MTTHAKLKARGLDAATGIPDDTADKLYTELGGKYMAVVELSISEHSERDDGDQTVTLSALHLELAHDPEISDHLRALASALYRARTPVQLDIDSSFDDVEPDAAEIVRRGAGLLNCVHCLLPLAAGQVIHAPIDRDEDATDPCVWRPCKHPVTTGDPHCTHTHNAGMTVDLEGVHTRPEHGVAVAVKEPFRV